MRGRIREVTASHGVLQMPNGAHANFRTDQCFLYGVCLQEVQLSEVIPEGECSLPPSHVSLSCFKSFDGMRFKRSRDHLSNNTIIESVLYNMSVDIFPLVHSIS